MEKEFMAAPGSGKEWFSHLKAELPSQLPAYLKSQRWFGGKAREIRAAEVVDVIKIQRAGLSGLVLLVNVEYEGGGADLYSIPVVATAASDATTRDTGQEHVAVLRLSGRDGVESVAFTDALKNENFLGLLLDAIQRGLIFTGEFGELCTAHTHALALQETGAAGSLRPRAIKAEQSNSSIAYGERLILKFFRRLEEGVNPDLEMTGFLTEKAHYQHTPQLLGALEYVNRQGRTMTQGVLQTFVSNQGDAWQYTMESIADFYKRVANVDFEDFPTRAQSDSAHSSIEPFLESVGVLARRTAELHLALASGPTTQNPDFAPESFDAKFQEGFEQALLELTRRIFHQLRKSSDGLSEAVKNKALEILSEEDNIGQRFHSALSHPIHALRTRIHGDYHLGQVLYTGADFVIIDFEGEPARPLSQRRLKRSPLQDVAGMLRSFHYAAHAPLLGSSGAAKFEEGEKKNLSAWAEVWAKWVGDRYLEDYLNIAGGAPFLPPTRTEIMALLQLHLLEKAVYELGYELNNRPDWVAIPLAGISKTLKTSIS
jgi:maltose alpha-D-glucosyltransferase/alpha-amylase